MTFLILCFLGMHFQVSGDSQTKKKLEIKSVTFQGNHAFSAGDLRKVMISRPSSFLHKSYYHPQVFQQDLSNLQLFYQQHGYLQAEITDHQVKIDSSKSEVFIHITVHEGQLTRVEGVSVFGNKFFTDMQLLKKIKISNGQPLETQTIENSNVAILTMYSDNGFLNAEVNPDIKVNDTTHTAIVDFMINERIQYTIDSIRIQGLDDIKPYVVQRELKFRSGQVVSYSRLLTSQQNLYLTGLFQSVYIQPKPASSGDSTQKDILIELKEIIPGNFTASVGYGTIEKLKGRLEVANINFRGTAQQIGAVVGASFINRDLQGSFREPWTFGTRWGTSVTAQWQYLSQPGYQAHTVGGYVSIGRKFMKISHASLTYQLERASLSNVSTTEIPLDLTNNISSLTLGLVYDSRDDLFNPTRGLYARFSNEFAGYFLSGSVAFFRTLGELKYFYLLRRNTVLATAISGGRIDPSQGFNSLPLNERFYTGGPNTLRGYDYQKAGPLDKNGVPIGGEMMLVWHLFEIRQGIYKMFGGVLFMDLGNVWERPRNFTIRDIRYDAGIGLRVNTPIGLVRLDYAFKINRRSGQSVGNLYFGMGQAF